MNTSEEVDLSGFPIIRIDQIPLVSSDVLDKAVAEVNDLINSLINEASSDTVPPMAQYLRKQKEAMNVELSERAARDRISALLNEASGLVTAKDVKEKLRPALPQPLVKKSQSHNGQEDNKERINIGFKPLPLPSELQTVTKGNDDKSSNSSNGTTVASLKSSKSVDAAVANKVNRKKDIKVSDTGSEADDEHDASDDNSANIENGSILRTHSTSSVDRVSSASSTNSSKVNGRRRESKYRTEPKKGISHRGPSKSYIEVFNENFGSTFIVPPVAGERRRRIEPPKKTPQLSVEEQKNIDRSERRKQAMQRLVARKEERAQYLLKKKEAERKARAMREAQAAIQKRQQERVQREKELEKQQQRKQPVNGTSSRITAVSASEQHPDSERDDKKSESEWTGSAATTEVTVNSGVEACESAAIDTPAQEELIDLDSSGSESVSGGDDDYFCSRNADESSADILDDVPTAVSEEISQALDPDSSDAGESIKVLGRETEDNAIGSNTSNIDTSHSTDNSNRIDDVVSPTDDNSCNNIAANANSALSSTIDDIDNPIHTENSSIKFGSITQKGKTQAHNNKVPSGSDRADSDEDDEPIAFVLKESVAAKTSAALATLRAMKVKKSKTDSSSAENSVVIPPEDVNNNSDNGCPRIDDDSNHSKQAKVMEDNQVIGSAEENRVSSPVGCNGIDAGVTIDADRRPAWSSSQTSPINSSDNSNNDRKPLEEQSLELNREAITSTAVENVLSTNRKLLDSPDTAAEPLSSRSSSRPISAVRTPNVRITDQLLTGVAQSKLLVKQGGVYVCCRGADDLPGLAAWQLNSVVQGEPTWTTNVSTYNSLKTNIFDECGPNNNTTLFLTRQANRKNVSVGLVLLIMDCESILLGEEHLFSSSHFTSLWSELVSRFDERAEFLSLQYGADALYNFVTVCGNCHAICKKLEHLLTTHFNGAELHDNNHTGNTSENLQAVPAHQLLRTESTCIIMPFTTDDTQVIKNEMPSPLLSPLTQQKQLLKARQQKVVSSTSNLSPIAMASTMATESFESRKIISTSEIDNQQQVVDRSDTSTFKADSELPNETRAPVVEESRQSSEKNLNQSMFKLGSIYPHIGMIFPAAYTQILGTSASAPSTIRGGEVGESVAKALVESMRVQTNVYEEWMEVMSDYSTVFSDSFRGVQENHQSDLAASSSLSGINNNSLPPSTNKRPRTVGIAMSDSAGGTSTEAADDPSRNMTFYKGGSRSLHFRVKSSRPEVYNIVVDVFNNKLPNWEELPSGLGLGLSWNVLWTWSKPRIKMSNLLVWQKVNHYPDSKQLTRKDLLKKNIYRYTSIIGSKTAAEFQIMPQTFLLPHEYTSFVQAFTDIESKKDVTAAQNVWILKPIGMSRGRGISLVKDLSQVTYSQSSVLQQYVERPLCLNGYKFDLRLYVLVTSFKPLEAFIYKEGFARISTHLYSLRSEDLDNKFIHLTNSSIQKHNQEGLTDDNPLSSTADNPDNEDTGGSKISLLGNHGLWQRLEGMGIDTAAVWESICVLVVKSLVITDDKMVHQECCFELFGYDVLIDADLRPWLIEVNASPSLARMNSLDSRVKESMIKDIIMLLDPAPFDRAAVLKVLRRRLKGLSKNKAALGRNDPEWEKDLKLILGNYIPRAYGEVPKCLGNYEMLAPNTNHYSHVLKLRKRIIKS